ncbi:MULTISPECIES: DUF6160 family protein [unclassified Alcanivorax]|uniref:DUF6160 family protein n=1 Tax=unclassified Alcanivorax TaxID=2638842 RepID=UPI00089FD10B|nr:MULTISPECIES: DUF6160 family protein [unclassified Alcanivorax]MEE3388415.1 DUF6160 family protein [Pseudomonadota bacterium]SEF80338.1 hypothetical protein SAMN04515663_103409 [Alcanivorax sp. DSM 26293]
MLTKHKKKRFSRVLATLLAAMPLLAQAAMESLDEESLSQVTGTGLAIGFEDFRWLVKPTSYFEQVGSDPVGDTTLQRGDLRWYGVNISGAGPGGFHWDESGGNFGTPCDASSLGCPRGGLIADFAPHDNPYLLRAFSPRGVSYEGTIINSDPDNPDKTIYEYLAPSAQPDYTLSFWGELEVGRSGNNNNLAVGTGDLLKTQTIIRGNAANSAFRLFQFTQPGNETFAILYHSYLKGDFRFSAAQQTGSASDDVGEPVRFDALEGLHFKNVDAYVPLGQLYYQALTLNTVPSQDGNFILEIPRLPDVPTHTAVHDHFYSLVVPDSTDAGYITARAALLTQTPGATPTHTVDDAYFVTHGHSRWGDWYPCRGLGCPAISTTPSPSRNAYNDTSDGIFFRKCESCDDFDAFAYMITAVDIRTGTNEYSCPGGNNCGNYTPRGGIGSVADRYYRQAVNCNASNGSDYQCGYGGSYSIDSGPDYTTVNKVNPSTFFGVSGGSNLPVIRTDVANIGDARIEGLQVNYLKFTSYGAGN